jgi:hypothetical protein
LNLQVALYIGGAEIARDDLLWMQEQWRRALHFFSERRVSPEEKFSGSSPTQIATDGQISWLGGQKLLGRPSLGMLSTIAE